MNFNQPTRQAPIGIIANFLFSMQKVVRAFFPILLIFYLKDTTSFEMRWLLWGAFLLVSSLVLAYLRYRNFYFYIDHTTQSFILERGIFNKSKLTIPLEKIQQVNIDQRFIHKIVGVYAVTVDSAGSTDQEVVIDSITQQMAQALKVALLAAATKFESTQSSFKEEKPEITAYEIPFLTLLKVGLTSNYLQTFLIVITFFLSFYDRFFKVLFKGATEEEVLETYIRSDLEKVLWIYGILLLAVMILLVNVIRTLLKFYGFQVAIEAKTLFLSHGLLNTRKTLIQPKRVQMIQVVSNYFQRKMDLVRIKIKQVGGETSQDRKKMGLEIPGCSLEEQAAFTTLIFGRLVSEPLLVLKPNYRYFVFRFFVFGLIPLSVYAFLVDYTFDWWWYVGGGLGYLTVVGLVVLRLFRVRKLLVSDDFIVVRSGFWEVTETILEPNKIQKVTISQYFWQTKANVGALQLYTAAGVVRFPTTTYDQLRSLMNVWLYQVEDSTQGWM